MRQRPDVIKVGGNDLAAPGFVEALAETVAARQVAHPTIIVHGGGRAIDALMSDLNIQPAYVDGQRVTDEATLDAAEMVLSGQVNKRLVLALLRAGVDALGLSGVDRSLLRVEPWGGDMGRVGRVVDVRVDWLLVLCAEGVVPVVSPISIGPEGRYNVNADHAAGAIAGAVDAASATFLTNVPGVQITGEIAERLTAEQTRQLIAEGTIHGGMIPKVNAALHALMEGAGLALITNLNGLSTGSGTTIVE